MAETNTQATAATEPVTGTGQESGTPGTAGTASGTQPSTFDEFLADPKNQAEFDRRVSKALETARTTFESRQQAAIDEALKVQKMTDDQKASYAQQQLQKQLNEREAALTSRELRLNAIDRLAEKNLPVELADALSYTDAAACEKSMDSVTKAFEKAVSKAVDAKLRQDPPKAGEHNTGGFTDALRNAAGVK